MSDNPQDTVPRSRLNEEIQKLKEAQARIAQLETDNQQLGRKLVGFEAMSEKGEEYRKQLDQAKADAQMWQQRYKDDLPLAKDGIDEGVIGYLRYVHAESGDQQPFGEFVRQHKNDPSSPHHRFLVPQQQVQQEQPPTQDADPAGDQPPQHDAPPATKPPGGDQPPATPPAVPPRAPTKPMPPQSGPLTPQAIAQLDLNNEADLATWNQVVEGKL